MSDIKRQITEEMGVHKEWYAEARKMTLEALPEFLRKLSEDYHHDYGTVCHMLAAGAVATCWALDKSEGARGGITGFQSGAVMWQFIAEWQSKQGQPLRLVDYDNMLYPQYADHFARTITPDTWEWLQKEAQKRLDDAKADGPVSSRVTEHWRSIVAGRVPFGYEVRGR